MLKRSLTLPVLLLSFVILTSCSSQVLRKLPIPDVEVTADMGKDGANVGHIISDAQKQITQAEWDAVRQGYMCLSPSGYGDLKSWIEKVCKMVKCDPKLTRALRRFHNRVPEETKALIPEKP